MKILDRYVLTELLKSFGIILFSIVFLFLIFDFSLNAGKYVRSGVEISEIAGYYSRYTPSLISNSMPMVLLLSLFWSMNRLNKNREIAAFQASGISMLRLCLPLLIMGLFIAFADYFIEEEVNTKNARFLNHFEERLKGRKTSDTFEKQYFFTDVNSSLLWVPKYNFETSKMEGITEFGITWDCYGPDDNPMMRMFAGSGEFIGDSWWLYDVKIMQLSGGKEVTAPHIYKRIRVFQWDFRPSELQKTKDFGELRVSRLQKRIEKYRLIQPEMARNMSVELHNRFALPLMNLVALLLSIPFAFRIKRSQSVLGGIGISLLLVFAYYGVYTVSIVLGKHGFFVPYIIWAPNVVFSGLGILLFKVHS